jgi:hypothetical protein
MTITTIPWDECPRNQVQNHAFQAPPALTEENFPSLPRPSMNMHFPHPPAEAKRAWAEAAYPRFKFYNALPLELRRDVTRFYMHSSAYIHNELDVDGWRYRSNGSMGTKLPPFLPPICQASKQTLSEAAIVFIEESDWKIRSMKANIWLTDFLDSFTVHEDGSETGDEVGFRAMRTMHFSSFHRFGGIQEMGRNLDLQLMKRCTGLRNLTLTFHVSITHYWDADAKQFVLKTVEQIVDFYGLQDIFLCRSLKKFRIDGITRNDYRQDAEDRLEEVAHWVRDGFLERWNQVVDVELVWRTNSYFFRYGY